MAGHDPLAIANAFIKVAREDGKPLDHLQLQKLVYYAHGWHLGVFGRPLLDEPIQAWRYGPVVKSLWKKLRRYGKEPINEPIKDSDYSGNYTPSVRGEDAELVDHLVRKVLREYGDFSGGELSAMTHRNGTPWSCVERKYKNPATGELPRDLDIPDEVIQKYFETLLDEQ